MRFNLRFAAVSSLLYASLAASAQTIDTYPSWNGIDALIIFGNPDTSTYGQSLTAPTTSTFSSYTTSFISNGGSTFGFQMYLAAWNPATSRITGPILYASPVVTSPANGAGFVSYTFTPNVPVVAGTTYMAFTSTLGQASRPVNGAGQAFTLNNPYAGGSGYFINSAEGGSSLAALSTVSWNNAVNDFAFRATFVPTATPEPATIAALGLGAAVFVKRRRI